MTVSFTCSCVFLSIHIEAGSYKRLLKDAARQAGLQQRCWHWLRKESPQMFWRFFGYVFNRNKKLLGAKGIATSSKDATRGAPGLTTRSKKLLGAQ